MMLSSQSRLFIGSEGGLRRFFACLWSLLHLTGVDAITVADLGNLARLRCSIMFHTQPAIHDCLEFSSLLLRSCHCERMHERRCWCRRSTKSGQAPSTHWSQLTIVSPSHLITKPPTQTMLHGDKAKTLKMRLCPVLTAGIGGELHA